MNLKNLVLIVLPLIFCQFISAQTYDYKLVRAGFKYKNKTAGIYVIRSTTDWVNLWNSSISEKDQLPIIDFNNEILIAVFRTVCPTAEYGVNIHTIRFVNKDLLVEIEYLNPGENCRRTMDSTMPYALYTIKKSNKVIYFKESTVLKPCN